MITRTLCSGVLVAVTATCAPAAAQQQQKSNILFIMGDDIVWMQPSIYHQGLMVGEKRPTLIALGRKARGSLTTWRCRVARRAATPSSFTSTPVAVPSGVVVTVLAAFANRRGRSSASTTVRTRVSGGLPS